MTGVFFVRAGFLSNYYRSKVVFEGAEYKSAEHAYQAAKSLDYSERARVASCKSPGDAQRMGRSLSVRADWDVVKEKVMMDILRNKFSRPELRSRLIATGKEYLEEGNFWHDKYWGVCHCAVCHGEGENRLGFLLMLLRDELISDDRLKERARSGRSRTTS